RFRLARAEAAQLCLLEQIVTGEHLVGAFTREHDLEVAAMSEIGQREQRRGGGAQDRLFAVSYCLRGQAGGGGGRAGDALVRGAERADHLLLMLALVELGALEGKREGAQAIRYEMLRRRGDER